ncbi:MAG: nucleotidyltransferase [Deltaproteobacteria bacterium]|nr:nucleotidyltransferase [Deltaproteobacteria bacterium]
MELTDSQLGYFVDNCLKLPKGKRSELLGQVDNLISVFTATAKKDPVINIRKFLKTGSLWKGTVLRPRGNFGVDADIAVFLNTDGANELDLASLHHRLRLLLCAAYPQKKPEDFTVQPRTLGVVFRVSGMDVDLVPIIPIEGPGDYGWQPSSQGDPPVKTSVTKQLEFIRARKDGYLLFTALVRLLKYWRNHQELDQTLRSFMIDLIVSHLQDAGGTPPSLEDGLLRFFLYVAQSELRDPIVFRENGKVTSLPKDPVVILDPVNADNNVARRLTDLDRGEIVTKATEAWERLTAARNNNFKGETLEYWKEVFGRSFVIGE